MRLIDADALDEKLEELKVRYMAQGRKAVAEDYNFIQTVLLTAPTVDAVEVVNGRWISVEDRLPEVGQCVLVWCESRMFKKHITISTYMRTYSAERETYFSRRVRNVTHWMPLPQPPKGE